MRFITLVITSLLLLVSTGVATELPLLNPEWNLSRVDADFELADGAGWDGRANLFVPDVKGEKLLQFNLRNAQAKPKTLLQGIRISGCCFQLGKLYFSDNGNSRICTFDIVTRKTAILAQLDSKNRPNDLTVDSQGNVYVTITRSGQIKKISAKGQQSTLAEGLAGPNGIAISPDESCLYTSSVKTGLISKVMIDGNDPGSHEPIDFAQLEETPDGFKGDGMCVDRAGNVYVTGAKAVSVFRPDGKQIARLETPERPINVIIGGVEGWTLYISTFGGLYQQRLHAYGVNPDPGTDLPADAPRSTAVNGIKSSLNEVYYQDATRKLRMDVFQPITASSAPRPAIVVIHGGGWAKGDKSKFRELALRLAARGWVTAVIEYRLAFEARFPAAIQDCQAAVCYLKENADRWDIDPNRIGALGGSAGGHLVGLMASGHADAKLQHRGTKLSPRLGAAVVMAGPLQIATGSVAERSHNPTAKSNAVNWIGNTIDELPQMYSLADAYEKIDSSTPPILFLAGSLDNPPRNQPCRDKLESLNIRTGLVVHENAKHGHWNQPAWIGRVVEDIDAFFAETL